jgi:hypothetical protein
MKPQKFTTENTEKKNFRFFKSSVNSEVASSQKEFPFDILIVNTFSVFSVVKY